MQANTSSAARIVILGTGGTIAGRAEAGGGNVAYQAGAVAVEQLLGGVPVPEGVTLGCEQVAQLDSKDMDEACWLALLERLRRHLADPAVRGVVVTHGTDTLEETAYFLHAVLRPAKPVVLTCAMRPTTALLSDGPQNLADALVVAALGGWPGVCVVCSGRIHDAVSVQKVHGYRVDAFASGDAGPLGLVEEGRVLWHRRQALESLALAPLNVDRLARCSSANWPRVALLTSHAGAQAWEVEALLAAGVQGLVVATTGNGTMHQAWSVPLAEAARRGVLVWRSSRCGAGRIVEGGASDWPVARGLNPAKARVALMLQLMGAAE